MSAQSTVVTSSTVMPTHDITTSVKPNFFLIGAPKCGTTAMASYLVTHPQFCLSELKEPQFWTDECSNELTGVPNLDAYLNLFRPTQNTKVIGEASTSTIWSDNALKDIIRFNPEAKFLAMVRNPLDMVRSLHWERLFNYMEDVRDFETAWRLQTERAEGRNIPRCCYFPAELQYKKIASLGTQLQRLYNLVPESQRLVLVLDDFTRHPREEYLKVLSFLNLDDDGRVEFPTVRAARESMLPLLSRWLKRPPFLPHTWNAQAAALASRLGMRRLRTSLLYKLGKPARPPKISPQLTEELKIVFESEIQLMEKLLQRDFKHWRIT